MSLICGICYKCFSCIDYDVCECCEVRDDYNKIYFFIKIKILMFLLINFRVFCIKLFYLGEINIRK